MKTLASILILMSFSVAHASWLSTKCSNSDGTVNWIESPNENEINLRYFNFVEGTLTLPLEKVKIKHSTPVPLDQQNYETCQYFGASKVFASKVKVTASASHPEVLRSQFPENKVVTDVICTTTIIKEKPCQ